MSRSFDGERDRIVRLGRAAWQRLKKEKSWQDWLATGELLQLLREEAMHEAGVNRPEGKGYNLAFGLKLSENKLDDMDKGDRARLFNIMDNLAPIEQWRSTLTLQERIKYNHPNSVWRKYQKAIEPPPKAEEGEAKPTLRDSVANLSEEADDLRRQLQQAHARIAELEEELAGAKALLDQHGIAHAEEVRS